jgi:hypothetical protein
MRSLRLQIDERYGLGRQPQRQANPIRQVILPARLRYRPSWSLRLSEPSRIVAVSLHRRRDFVAYSNGRSLLVPPP